MRGGNTIKRMKRKENAERGKNGRLASYVSSTTAKNLQI
jgi:hypothetical protein